MPSWPLHRALLARAHSTLMSAWNDYYSRDYEWAIIKAWNAASTALLLHEPTGTSPVSLRALTSPCHELELNAQSLALLDTLYALATDPWIRLAAGEEAYKPSKAAALAGLEEAVRTVEAALACGPGKRVTPRPINVDWPASIRVGPILILLYDEARGEPIYERHLAHRNKLIPGYYTVILSRDEALAYASLPGPATHALLVEIEPVTDEDGSASLITSAARHTPQPL